MVTLKIVIFFSISTFSHPFLIGTPPPTGNPIGDPKNLICNFENSNNCGYTNIQGDDFDWTRNTGATGSAGTGPFADHTLGTKSGKYLGSTNLQICNHS